MKQKERVLRLLQARERGVCSETFTYELRPGIPRAAARVWDLRKEGWNIKTEPCDLHTHLKGGTSKARRVDKYRLETFILNRSQIKLAPEDRSIQ
jgi:hypothetical protein